MTDIVSRELGELRRLISSGQVTLAEVMDRLAPKTEVESAEKPKPPKAVVLSPADRKALRTLPAKLADVELPASPRQLTQDERNVLVPLFDQIKVAAAAIKKAEEAFKEAAHNDVDSQAKPGDQLGKNGHYLTEGEVVAEGYDKKIVRGLVGGHAVELTTVDLEKLLDEGKITLAQFRRWTKPVNTRQVVADAIMADMAKDQEVLEVISTVARRTDQTTAIRMAKN